MHNAQCWWGQSISGLEQRRFQTADQSLIYTGQVGVVVIIQTSVLEVAGTNLGYFTCIPL